MAKTGNVKVTLADGTVLEGLTLNGNNFVSSTEIDSSIFDGNLSRVTVEVPDGEDDAGLGGTNAHLRLVRCEHDDGLGGFAFAFRQLSESEIKELEIESRLDYLEMISNV